MFVKAFELTDESESVPPHKMSGLQAIGICPKFEIFLVT